MPHGTLFACTLLLILALAAGASAVPRSQVRSAMGDAAARNAAGPGEWLPQLSANGIFRQALPAGGELGPLRRAPMNVRVTELRPGEVRLVFVDGQRYAMRGATFLVVGP